MRKHYLNLSICNLLRVVTIKYIKPSFCLANMQIERIQAIINNILRERQRVCRTEYHADYNVAGVLLYGSRVRGDYEDKSDIDLGIVARTDREADVDNFTMLLRQRLHRENPKERIPTDHFETYLLGETDFKEKIFSTHGTIKGNYLVVTPFRDVRRIIEINAGIRAS
jgi:predicted nucleotidyltransferase